MEKMEAEVSTVLSKKHASKRKNQQLKQSKNAEHILLGSIIPIILLIVWEILSRLEVFPAYMLPAPSVVLGTIVGLGQDGSLWGHIGITTYRVLAGFVLGTAVAVVLGSFVGFYQKAEQ